MGEETQRDLKAVRNGKLPQWAWGLILGALGIGGPSGALAYLRGEPTDDPRVVAAEAKVEALKAAEIQDIKTKVDSVEREQKRQGRLMSRIAEKLRVKDNEPEDER